MKLLLAAANYPQLSETYITTEIDFFLRSGLAVEVWSPAVTSPGATEQVRVHRGTLREAVHLFRPDVVHCHYVHFAPGVDAGLSGTDLPLTVRGHSFDFSIERAEKAAAIPRVRKVYLFPHLARRCRSEKIVPLPVAYNTAVYGKTPGKNRKLVLRFAAAKADKGLRDFLLASKHCPDHSFMLGVADVADSPAFFHKLKAMNETVGGRSKLLHNVIWDRARELTRSAGIYLGTSDPTGHPFGMPVSIAESLATGSLVLLRRDVEASKEYLGEAGMLYGSPEEAAEIIRKSLSWDDARWKAVEDAACERAAAFADLAVLPRMMDDWRSFS